MGRGEQKKTGPERYRSGRNGIDSKSIWGLTALTGVRIPLSPPDVSPRMSSEVRNPLEIAGFLLPWVRQRPKKSFDILSCFPYPQSIRVDKSYVSAVQLDIPKKDCIRMVESLFQIIKDEMGKGNDVMISGFGKWTVKA
jgi:hypothetical protein